MVCVLGLTVAVLPGQDSQHLTQPGTLPHASSSPCGSSEQPQSKRVFGIIPNYRTSGCLQNFKPLTAREKFKIASQDAFDRGTVVLALAFAGESQLANSNPAFGHGFGAYAQYAAASYGDFVIGDFMTEGIFPSLLHQDPRYFRHGSGSTGRRLAYAVGQIILTHNDSGKTAFNFSELAGNASAVAISESYYVSERDASDAGEKLASQLGVDAASNVLKEFWPDILRKFGHH